MTINQDDTKIVKLHDSQAMIQIINANTTYCTWQRGGGKTGGGIGPRFLHLSEVMPKSQVLLFSDTYDRLKDRIVPNIIEFLQNKLGLIEGVDFVKYKKPPENWAKPLTPLDAFEHVISFASGMALCLVSLRIEGSANAYNAQAGIGDEVKFCDEGKIAAEVLPAIRGHEDKFGHLPEYLSVWMFTDKWGPKVKWLLKKRDRIKNDDNNSKAVDFIYLMQMEIFRLQAEIKMAKETSNPSKFYSLTKLMGTYKSKADKLRKHVIYFSDMKPYENKATLGDFYFKRQKRICKSEMEYDVAILNKDPDKVETCFYPSFTNANKYHCKPREDYDTNLPIWTAFDYNFRISPMPVVQLGMLPASAYTTVNFIDAIYTLHPLGLADCIELFCKRYENHQNKVIHFIFDHTAIGRSPLKTTFKGEVVTKFDSLGWDVIQHFIGDAPDHDIKHQLFKRLLPMTGDNAVRVNEVTCEQLIKSIEMSPAKMSGDKTKKDKSTETDDDWPAEDSTHFSDAFDMILWGGFEWGVFNSSSAYAIPMSIG